jgi:hypothetical protein
VDRAFRVRTLEIVIETRYIAIIARIIIEIAEEASLKPSSLVSTAFLTL